MAVMEYRTQDRRAYYGFSIEYQPARGWRVYIIFDSFYTGGGDIPQLPYQSFDEDGRRYVTWRSKLDNLEDAKTVAELWAELVHGYQREQEEHGLYVELIKRYKHARRKKR